MKRNLITGLFLVVCLVGFIFLVRTLKMPDSTPLDLTKTKGNKESPIEIIEYSDFQCPTCSYAQTYVSELLEKYPGKIKLTFRHFPLPTHKHAIKAHVAAECAGQLGGFWPYHDKLFESQAVWSKSKDPNRYFMKFAKELGLDFNLFKNCLLNPETLGQIQAERQAGIDSGVRSTPTFFIQGEAFVGVKPLKAKAELKIDAELKKRGLL